MFDGKSILVTGGTGDGETIRIVTPREIGMTEGLFRSVVPYEPDAGDVEPIRELRQKYEAGGGQRCVI